MTRSFSILALALLLSAGLPAATVNSTLTVTNASGSLSGSISGPATLTNIGSGGSTVSGTIAATISLSPDASGNFSVPFTITFPSATGGPGTMIGTVKVPPSALSGGPLTGSATITSGTGTFAGVTGSFPSLTGSGSIGVTITLSFTGAGTITTGGTVGPPTPTITDVLDGAGYTKNIAQGSIFVVKGSGLSASGVNSFGIPRPTSSNGVKITFAPASGGAGTDAFLVYTYNQGDVNQLAGILPSTVAPGNYNVTVTNGSVSAPFTTQVVQRKPALFTQAQDGAGLAIVQNFISATQYDLNRFTVGTSNGSTISPGRPGQVLIAWGTGLGPLVGGDNTASPLFDFAANGVDVKVIVGGVSLTPFYAGRAGYAGEDQINFTLPSNIPTGCTVSFQVSVSGVLSNPTFIAIAPDASSSACVVPGFTTAQLQRFDQGGTYTSGGFTLSQSSSNFPQLGPLKSKSANGGFIRYTGFQLAALASQSQPSSSSGACQVTRVVATPGQVASGTPKGLDAGPITLNGPGGSNITNMAFQQGEFNSYHLDLGTEPAIPGLPVVNTTIVAGTYSVRGTGGKDVGSFNASVTLGPPFTITGGLPSTVTRSAGLPLNWTGGNATDQVVISGSAGTSDDYTFFVCVTTAGAGNFTVPSSVLQQLPAVSSSAITSGSGFGNLTVSSGVNASLTAPLTAGGSIDAGFFLSSQGVLGTPTFQ